MIIRILLFSSLLLLAGIRLQAQITINPNAEQDIQLVKDYITALVAADAAKAASLMNDDAWSYGPAYGDSLNRTQVGEVWTGIGRDRTDQDAGIGPTLSVVVPEGPTAGTWVLVWGTYTATDKASQAKLVAPYQLTVRLEDGKIQNVYRYFDNLAPAEAMGMELKPKQ